MVLYFLLDNNLFFFILNKKLIIYSEIKTNFLLLYKAFNYFYFIKLIKRINAFFYTQNIIYYLLIILLSTTAAKSLFLCRENTFCGLVLN